MATEPTSRLSQIATVISDVDGVMTDGTVGYSYMSRSFSVRDGHGVQLLKEAGVRVILMSGESDTSIANRASKLGVEFYWTPDKLDCATKRLGLNMETTAFIGDDIPDIPLLKAVRYAGCPADADLAVQRVIARLGITKGNAYACLSDGGRHCFREFVNWLL